MLCLFALCFGGPTGSWCNLNFSYNHVQGFSFPSLTITLKMEHWFSTCEQGPLNLDPLQPKLFSVLCYAVVKVYMHAVVVDHVQNSHSSKNVRKPQVCTVFATL